MIVSINKPVKPKLKWADIKEGDVFSWGTQSVWYVKLNVHEYAPIGCTGGIVHNTDVAHCSSLVVATKVEITP